MWFKNWWLFLFIDYAENAIDAKKKFNQFSSIFLFLIDCENPRT